MLVKQHTLGQRADESDWVIGAGLLLADGSGIRSLANPGAAFSHPALGQDNQPAHMSDYVVLPNAQAGDWAGVHVNSGIPNHAFYRLATDLGGFAWERAGYIWYHALVEDRLPGDVEFAEFAQRTCDVAAKRFGTGSRELTAVGDAWESVGVTPRPRDT